MNQLPRARETGRNVKGSLSIFVGGYWRDYLSCYWRDYWMSGATNIWGLSMTKEKTQWKLNSFLYHGRILRNWIDNVAFILQLHTAREIPESSLNY